MLLWFNKVINAELYGDQMWQRGTIRSVVNGPGRPAVAAINGLGEQFWGISCSMTGHLVECVDSYPEVFRRSYRL